jgi:hypothetical protein
MKHSYVESDGIENGKKWQATSVGIFREGGAHMANEQEQTSKADVQSTELNKMPAADQSDTELSAEVAAEVFRGNQTTRKTTPEQ